MKSHQSDREKLDGLLEKVLPPNAGSLGPDLTQVLEIAARERRRRMIRKRTVYGSVAVFLFAMGMVFTHQKLSQTDSISTAATSYEQAASAAPPQDETFNSSPKAAGTRTIVINQINDEQFDALLGSVPSAVMNMPDGSRTLLVLDQYGEPHRIRSRTLD